MRAFLLLSLLLSTSVIWSFDGKELVQRYRIVSDSLDTTIAPGTFIIEGKVTRKNLSVNEAYISNYPKTKSVQTDKLGRYKIQLPETDSVIFFHHPAFFEVVVKNYDFKPQHRIRIDFFVKRSDDIEMVKKPVVYLTAPQDTEVEVKLQPKGQLTFLYPKYDNGWKGTVHPDGTFSTKDGEYPYLFWEAEQAIPLQSSEEQIFPVGHYVERQHLVSFFEQHLSSLGFNETERTDFITFWAPQLSQFEVSAIRFLMNEQVAERIGELEVTPTPKNQLRVYMLCADASNVSHKFVRSKVDYPGLQRNGLTVLEWGGTILPPLKMNNHEKLSTGFSASNSTATPENVCE